MMRILFLQLFCLVLSIGVVAQDTQRLPEGVHRPNYGWIKVKAAEQVDSRIDPPNWWVGMKQGALELMIHHKGIGNYIPYFDYEGVELISYNSGENENYLFVQLMIHSDASPGAIAIECRREGDQSIHFSYPLLERSTDEQRISAIDASDLIYLIMPDRFANGDETNDSFDHLHQKGTDRSKMFFRHGGDIQGIINRLDYLEDLGITAIWLNPIQQNNQQYESYHGYAITDHYSVDERLGDLELYKQLVDSCQKKGIKVIMDVIHNHVGDQHYFFQDLPFESWIHQFHSFTKTNYRAPTLMDPYASKADKDIMSNAWFDHHMPDLNQDNAHLSRYLIQNNIWWIEYCGLDGYRIDTYAYPAQAFMRDWTKGILEEYPDFHLFAETWVHGEGIQSYFTKHQQWNSEKDNHLRSVTDFQLYYAINEALTEQADWTSGVNRVYYTLAQDYLYEDPFSLVTFLDNHDLSRFYSVIGEDLEKFKSGISFLLTTRGIPMLYYGTEILMKNLSDPDGLVREDFPGGWKTDAIDKFEENGRSLREQLAFEHVRTLAHYRKNTPALQKGKLLQFVPEKGLYVYFRYDEETTVMVVMNTTKDKKEVTLDRFDEVLNQYQRGKNILSNKWMDMEQNLNLDGFQTLVIELD